MTLSLELVIITLITLFLNFFMTLPQLAKLALETYIKEGKVILPPPGLPERFLQEKRGTFVTLEKKGQLRGCIGTYLPTKENIALEVISNAIAAGTKDWRFGPVKEEELPFLSYTVYILQKPERNTDEIVEVHIYRYITTDITLDTFSSQQ